MMVRKIWRSVFQSKIDQYQNGEYKGFKIGDRVKLIPSNPHDPSCIYLIKAFYGDYVICIDADTGKKFLGCNIEQLLKEKVLKK